MRLDPFIIDLLYDHDCVIIPEFGGLVANYRSAKLNGVSHVLQPPSKSIGFNPSLKYNDGLLTNYISSVLAISFKEAADQVAETVADFRRQMNENGRFSIDRVGVFYKDRSGQTQFIPQEQENFLLSSYGLQPIQLRLIGGVQVADSTKVIPMHSTASRKWKMAAAIVVPALLAGSWFLASRASRQGEMGFGFQNPFGEPRKQSTFAPTSSNWDLVMQFPTINYQELLSTTPSPSVIGESVISQEMDIARKADLVEPSDKASIPTKSTEKKPSSKLQLSDKHISPTTEEFEMAYSVIGGAFQIKENGLRLIEQLRDQGYDAQFAGMRDNLHLVAYGHYSRREEAEAVKAKVQASGAKAWIRTNQ
jgi:cell division septation protein DedD